MKGDLRQKIAIYDTTLRDGCQQTGISLSVSEKLRIVSALDELGIDYIEAGWPGSNPKDAEFFKQARRLKLRNAQIVAFGSTRRANVSVEQDINIAALVRSEVPTITLVGKASQLHVEKIIETTLAENLRMIEQSISFLIAQGRQVIFDAEHFFDGYTENPEYALSTLEAAQNAGARCLVLCDTNGGSLPEYVYDVVRVVREKISLPIGIHAHNDAELAVANSLAAIRAGVEQVQGTMHGIGERTGNANLLSIIPTLELKMNLFAIGKTKLRELSSIARRISEILNLNPDPSAPYIGAYAFSHKAGIHVAAVEKLRKSYEHIEPEAVGNSRDFIVSELSGRGNIKLFAQKLGIELAGKEAELLTELKALEHRGYQFENAEGSLELLLRRKQVSQGNRPFAVIDSMVVSEWQAGTSDSESRVRVTIKLAVAGSSKELFSAAEGHGPIHAFDVALKSALLPFYPQLDSVRLTDYKVRILNPSQATSACTRVLIQAESDGQVWSTVGCSDNIISASLEALIESYELFLLRLESLAATYREAV